MTAHPAVDVGADRLTEMFDALDGRRATSTDRPRLAVTTAPIEDDYTPGIVPAPVLAPVAFAGPLGEYATALGPYTEASPAAILVCLLAGFGAMCGRGPHQIISSTRHGTNLFVLLVGGTGSGRKGTAMNHARELLSCVAPEFWCKKTGRVLSGLGSGEALIGRLLPGQGPGQPVVPDVRLLVREPEFGGILAVKSRDGNTLSVTLRNAWDGETLGNVTKNDSRLVGEHHVALLAAVTADELRDGLSRADRHNGFGNRFLFAHSERTQILPNAGRPPAQIHEDAALLLERPFARALLEREVPLSRDAATWWAQWYPAWDALRTDDGGAGALTQRVPAQLRRLGLVYALASGRDAVEVEDLEAAEAVTVYSEATIAFALPAANPLSDLAQKILAALTLAGAVGLARAAIRDDVVRSNSVSKDAIDGALKSLHVRQLARMDREKTTGRPREVWRLARLTPTTAGSVA